MKVILEIDHTVSKEEIVNWIEEVLKPNTPCVWGYSFEEHHCESCHNSQLEKEKCELLGIIQGKDEVIAELKAQIIDIKEDVERERNKQRRLENDFTTDVLNSLLQKWELAK